MAYKFQSGKSTMSGNLVQEGTITLKDGTDNDISGSGEASFAGKLTAGDHDFQVSDAGNLTLANTATLSVVGGLASLDGGINVNDAFTVSTAGAVVAAGVNAGGALSGITTINSTGVATLDTGGNGSSFGGALTIGGALAGATTIAGSGLASLGSLAVDTGANIGCDGDTDLLTLAAQTFTVAADATLVATKISGSSLVGHFMNANFAQGLAEFDNDGLDISAQYAFAASGSISLAGASAAVIDITADSAYFLDDDGSQLVKRDSWADVISAMAGAGLTQNASSKKLEVSANAVNALDVNTAATDGATLSEGYNVLTGTDQTGSITVYLPASPSVGDVVNLKATSLAGAFTTTVSRKTAAHAIDGTSGSVVLESEYGALAFVYADTNDWRIF